MEGQWQETLIDSQHCPVDIDCQLPRNNKIAYLVVLAQRTTWFSAMIAPFESSLGLYLVTKVGLPAPQFRRQLCSQMYGVQSLVFEIVE